MGGDAFAVLGNVADAAEVNEMFATVVARFPRLDILVNNAGVQTWKPFLDVTEEEWDLVIDTNLKGCFLNSQAAARHMKEHGGGAIVNIGSGCNKVAFPNLVAYTASKGGIEMLTKVAAIELGRYGIRVNCVAPGAIEVERTRREGGDFARIWSAAHAARTHRHAVGYRPGRRLSGERRCVICERPDAVGRRRCVQPGAMAASMNRRPGPRRRAHSEPLGRLPLRPRRGHPLVDAPPRAASGPTFESARVWQAPHPDGEPRTWALPDRVGCMAECESGEFLLGSTKAICRSPWRETRGAAEAEGPDRGGARGSTHAHQ